MRLIISLFCFVLPILASAEELQIRDDAPDRHIVVTGDTLWDISAKFYKDPWKWPQLWLLNKENVKDPHWIYPGNVIVFNRSTGNLEVVTSPEENKLVGEQTAAQATSVETAESNTEPAPNQRISPSNVVKLSPKARVVSQNTEAIPAIPLNTISSFLARPLVIENEDLEISPKLVGTYEHRTLLSVNDLAYVQNLPNDKGTRWQIYRPSTVFVDPETEEELGREVMYLGEATVEKFGDTSTLRITNSVLEIHRGDYFAQTPSGFSTNYIPHAAPANISARVISVYGGVQQAGQRAVVTLNKGRRDGVEDGHIFGLYQKGEVIKTKGWFTPNIELPENRYGILLVFRVFNKVSYALVMETSLPVQRMDRAGSPE